MNYLQWVLYDGNGRKNLKCDKIENAKTKEKIPRWLPFHLRVYEMEPDSFPVSSDTENKPDLP